VHVCMRSSFARLSSLVIYGLRSDGSSRLSFGLSLPPEVFRMSLFASVPQARDDVAPSSSHGDTGLVTHGPFARAWVTALQRVICATRRRHWARCQ